jgi:hypothetical protein
VSCIYVVAKTSVFVVIFWAVTSRDCQKSTMGILTDEADWRSGNDPETYSRYAWFESQP